MVYFGDSYGFFHAVDAKTGEILWTGSIERKGSASQSVFRLGRVYSRGALALRMTNVLVDRLVTITEGTAGAVTAD